MSAPDLADPVADLMRRVAAEEILPRFRSLAAHEIAEKAPGDLVTAADHASEARLEAELSALLPSSVVVGEEAAAADPTVLGRLGLAAPVWVIDPLDGTANFAAGTACFAVIVALVERGATRMGWILDPIGGRIAWAAAGEGAYVREGEGTPRRLRMPEPAPIGTMTGSAGRRIRRRVEDWRVADRPDLPRLVHWGCVGQEYLALATGALQFAQYGNRLKPWDHAAGVLIHAEAGGHAAMAADGSPYAPTPNVREGRLRLAPDPATWRALAPILDGGDQPATP